MKPIEVLAVLVAAQVEAAKAGDTEMADAMNRATVAVTYMVAALDQVVKHDAREYRSDISEHIGYGVTVDAAQRALGQREWFPYDLKPH